MEVDHIRESLERLVRPGDVIELRIPNTARGTISGWYDDCSLLAEAAAKASGKVPAVYATINPVSPARLNGHPRNGVTGYAKTTTADVDIERLQQLLVDIDPVRETGVAATDEEHGSALELTFKIRDFLVDVGLPCPLVADSGNGGHLRFWIDVANMPEHVQLLKDVIHGLGDIFDTETVKVDPTTYNPSRIAKVYGTRSCKGRATAERPHRDSRVLEEGSGAVADEESLASVRRLLRMGADAGSTPVLTEGHVASVRQWLDEHHHKVASTKTLSTGAELMVLECCAWNPAHSNRSAFVMAFPNGRTFAKCHHASCAGREWDELPGSAGPRHGQHARSGATPPGPSLRVWPEPPAEAAFQGLAGDFVRLASPHTEADSAALLVNFLIFFGNVVGGSPHIPVGANRHGVNLFGAVVGRTSRARKGESLACVKAIFAMADRVWATTCVRGGLSTGEGLIKALEDGPVPDFEYERRLLAIEPEFAHVFNVGRRTGNTLKTTLRRLWDGDDLNVLTRHDPLTATNVHFSLIAQMTIAELKAEMSDLDAMNGFANRFLWVSAQRRQTLANPPPFTGSAVTAFAARLTEQVKRARLVNAIHRSGEANTYWEKLYEALSADTDEGPVASILARAEAQVLRLSALYALTSGTSTIEVAHIDGAVALWRYCEASAHYIFGTGDGVAEAILQALNEKPSLTRTAMSALFSRHKSADVIEQALGRLAALGHVRVTTRQTGGRPEEVWEAVR